MERKNLWAPWRIGYIQGLDKPNECFVCHNLKDTENDEKNFVLWRTDRSIVMLNRFPYNNGHLLIAPNRHVAGFDQADEGEILELIRLVRESQKALTFAIKPQGFNVGLNFGRCAGAGLPDHLHIHVVPRWEGDTSFMSACSDTKIISQSLKELLEQLRQVSQQHKLPNL